MQQTLVLVKPDGVRKNLIGEIISRFERRGLKVSALKLVKMTEAQAKFHYAEHEGKPFFGELVDFITSGPVAAMVISGENIVHGSDSEESAAREINNFFKPEEIY